MGAFACDCKEQGAIRATIILCWARRNRLAKAPYHPHARSCPVAEPLGRRGRANVVDADRTVTSVSVWNAHEQNAVVDEDYSPKAAPV